MNIREAVKDKKRIVIKIGSSSLMHNETGRLNLGKIEKLVRTIVDIKNSGKDVVLVSSGAIAVGRMAIGLNEKPDELPVKQACAAIGQAKLMMVYQKLFHQHILRLLHKDKDQHSQPTSAHHYVLFLQDLKSCSQRLQIQHRPYQSLLCI